ncbi:MBL fold metallo-hydrolase, partial [bacterium]
MKIQVIPVTPLQQNCSLLWCEETMRCAVVDPGGELERIHAAISQHGLTLEKVLLTHGHV